MRALAKKLHSRRGESLVEVLAAVLICALSVLLLASASVAAGNINHTASDHDEIYYQALNAAEARNEGPVASTTLTVSAAGASDVKVTVNLYGNKDEGIYSFAAVTPAPAPGGGSGP